MSEKRFQPVITLGNVLTFVTVVGGGCGFLLKYNDRLLMVEAAQTSGEQRDLNFQRETLQRLQDLQADIREMRNASGVRWRDLPPSAYQK